MFSLKGKSAVITGGGSGIGRAIALLFASRGAQVHILELNAASATDTVNDINLAEGKAKSYSCDVSSQQRVQETLKEIGTVDILVNNAGITRDKLLANMDASRWDSVIAVNIASQLKMNERFLASEAFSQQGRIVSLASTSGIAGNRGQTNYAASKAGIIGMVRATAPLLEPRGGSINAVAPGFIETDMTARMPALTRQVARRLSSLQQGGQPIDVAETIAFLASDGAAGVNGQVLRVCGQNMVGA